MKCRILFLVSLSFLLGVSSCSDDLFQEKKTAEISVSLQAGEGVRSVENAEITLRCLDGGYGGKPVTVPMSKSAKGRYDAFLPVNYVTDTPFVEVALDGRIYGYSPTDTCFEGGGLYAYSLVLDAGSLVPVQSGSEIKDWENSGSENVDATM